MLSLPAYSDYFDGALAKRAYASREEYLREHFALLDLCIEWSVACREEAGEGKEALPLRGMVITSDQMHATMRAARRGERTGRDPAPFLQARAHLLSRAAASEALLSFPCAFLFDVFSLDAFEQFCFFAALAVEWDRKYETLFGFLQDGIALKRPALGTIAALYRLAFGEEPACLSDFFFEEEGSHRLYLFELPEPVRGESALSTPLRLRDKIITYALGENRLAPALADFCVLLTPAQAYQPCESILSADVGRLLLRLIDGEERALVNLYGPKGCGKELSLRRFAGEHGIGFLRIDAAALAQADCPPEELARRITIEYLLDGALPLFVGLGEEGRREEEKRMLRLLFRHARIVLVLSEEKYHFDAPGVDGVYIPFSLPNGRDSLELWRYLGAEMGAPALDYAALACKYTLSPGEIRAALHNGALEAALEGAPLAQRHVVQAIRDNNIHNMKGQAKRIEPVFGWEDFVAPEATIDGLKRLCSRVKYRDVVLDEWGFSQKLPYGKSASALFYGPPGTGKTMAAQVVAKELELELYRVDLSEIMNKYIGETEKNLSRLFEEAKNSNGILFFDEADALFAKRTEVSDSKDKYANAETAFLLQKVEEYEGIVILATNLMHNFDDAFKRRITYIIPFEKPSKEERLLLWQRVFPENTRFDGPLDFAFLAEEFEFTGSTIKSIALNAAYDAAARGEGITMAHIVSALKLEYIKSGEILMRSKLGAYESE